MKFLRILLYIILFLFLFYTGTYSQDGFLKFDTSSYVDHNSTSFSIGIGNAFWFKRYNEAYSDWNLSVYSSIRLSKHFYLYAAINKYDHHSGQVSWILFLGPLYKINVIRKKIDFDIDISAAGIIGSTGYEGPGFATSLIITPLLKYYIWKNVYTGVELRNVILIPAKSVYSFNPLISISLNL